MAFNKGWQLHHLDVNNVFLHGELAEEIYLKPPLGYLQENDNRMCKLKKSFYGLKQTSRQWCAKLEKTLLDIGFTQSKANYSLFVRFQNNNIYHFLSGLCR